jgi:DNA-binding transcriptional ArsR family regulator
VSVISVSELRRALQNQRLDVEIMRCIEQMRSPNLSNLAEALGMDRKSVRYHLYKLKSGGCVRDRWVRLTTNFGYPILCHEWPLTEKGKRLLCKGGLIFPVFRLDDTASRGNTNAVPGGDHVGSIPATRPEPYSKVDRYRAEQAAAVIRSSRRVTDWAAAASLESRSHRRTEEESSSRARG